MGEFIVEWFRRNDVTAGGKYQVGQVLWLEAAVGIAGEHDRICVDIAMRRFDPWAIAMLDINDGRLLEDFNAELMRGARFTDAEIQRMQVAVAIAGKCPDKLIGPQQVAGLVPVPGFVFIRMIVFDPFLDVFIEVGQLAFLDRYFDESGLQIALNPVLFDALVNDVITAPFDVPNQVGDALAMLLCNLPEPADAVDQLAAVSSRRTPANPVGLDERDCIAAFRQGEGGCYARESGAADAKVR